MAYTGREILLEVLRSEEVRHVFGNPGSTELPFVDALAGADDIQYVLALQEATAVGMADGYAQATRRPAFVNLHSSAGLGNAIGNLTNVAANLTPMVVTAGQQDERHLWTDPLLSGDLVGIAAPVSKWAHEVRSIDELGSVLRRAFRTAAAPPAGPVFVSLRMDLLDRTTDASPPPPSEVSHASTAPRLDELARLLTEPPIGKLGIVVGDEVAASGAVDEAVALAEALAAPVHASPLYGSALFPPRHPLWMGMLPPSAAQINRALAGYERVLLVGGQAFVVYPFSPGPALPPELELLHLSPDPGQLGRAWPTRLGIAGDPKPSLAALVPMVRAGVDASAAASALEEARRRRDTDIAAREETARSRYATAPMDPMAAAHALLRSVPPGTAVVDEAVTTGVYVRGFHHDAVPDNYFFFRGGGLGWGMPAACGVSLGRDRSPVMCVVGDGATMYSPQALWTAAHERLPVVFAVVDNRQYRILKDYLRGMAGDSVRRDRFVAMDLDEPAIDFVALARSMGVDATLVEKADDVGDAVRAALDRGGPHLLHLPIAAP